MKNLKLNLCMVSLLFISSCNLWKDDFSKNDFDFEINGIAYNFVEDGVEVVAKTYPSNYSKDIIIPSMVDYEGMSYEVVGVGDNAFWESKVTSVILPETVRYLSYSCFDACEKLKSIDLPASLTNIEGQPFRNSGIESISIPASVYWLDMGPCPQLKSFTIEPSKSPLSTISLFGLIGEYGDSEKVEYIFIGRNIKNDYSDDYVFFPNLKKVEIGEFVTEFGASFYSTLEIICDPTLPPKTIGDCSAKCLQTSTVYVPENAIELYRQDSYWGRFKKIKALQD